MKGSVSVKEGADWTVTTGEQRSMITTVDQGRKGGKKRTSVTKATQTLC